MSNELAKNLGELNGSVKNYVQAKIDLLKLSFLEKTTRITAYLINYVVVILFSILVIGFGAAAFAIWYGESYDNYIEGVLIAGGILIISGCIFVVFRHKIITTSIIKNFSEIMFADEEEES